jgi:hypothetical protein
MVLKRPNNDGQQMIETTAGVGVTRKKEDQELDGWNESRTQWQRRDWKDSGWIESMAIGNRKTSVTYRLRSYIMCLLDAVHPRVPKKHSSEFY